MPPSRKTLTMLASTIATPNVTTFARLDSLGLRVVGQFIEPDRVVLWWRLADDDRICGRCEGKDHCGTA